MTSIGHPDEKKIRCIDRAKSGEDHFIIAQEERVGQSTIRRWVNEEKKLTAHKSGLSELRQKYVAPQVTVDKPDIIKPIIPPLSTSPRILAFDVEVLPNKGYFYDIYPEHGIPLPFIEVPKAICSIAWSWIGEEEIHVSISDEPYNERKPLEEFYPELLKADYILAHNIKFDSGHVSARMMVNKMGAFPTVNELCTYRMARGRFGRALNSNKLDHLATLLGVGKKLPGGVELFLPYIRKEIGGKEKVAEYNAHDVFLLKGIYGVLKGHTKNALNHNLHSDNPANVCDKCGSDNLTFRDYIYTPQSFKHRFQCNDCKAWSTFPAKKQ